MHCQLHPSIIKPILNLECPARLHPLPAHPQQAALSAVSVGQQLLLLPLLLLLLFLLVSGLLLFLFMLELCC